MAIYYTVLYDLDNKYQRIKKNFFSILYSQ